MAKVIDVGPPKLQTLIITGSSGLIGSAFINHVDTRYREMGFDREGPPNPPPSTDHVISCDMTSDESVRAALNEVRRLGETRIASVIHLAAYYDFAGKPSPLYQEVTVRGTERLLHGLRDFEVEQFIFSSTMLVHAPCEPGQRIHEDWPIAPKWDYPRSKVETEQLILRERGDVRVVLLRIAGVYDDQCHSIPIGHQIQRIHQRQFTARVFPGDIHRGQAFIHLQDLTELLENLVQRRHTLPQVTTLVVGEPETLSYDQLQRLISRELHGREWKTYRIPKPIAKLGAWIQDAMPGSDPFIKPWMIDLADDHYAIDLSRTRNLLGWAPRRSLREALPKMLTALQKDPESWYKSNKLPPPRGRTGPAWPHVANFFLGLWLIGTVPALGAISPALLWSDIASGMLCMFFALLALRRDWAAWATCGVGLWVMSAPLLFWSRNAAVYNNDLLVGTIIVVLAGVVPRLGSESSPPGNPPGWSYNPSSWPQRLGIVFLAFIGFFLSRYMAAFQLGHVAHPWDPFFGDGTRRVLTSDISRAFPVSDAGLGALSYLLDAVAGLIGGQRRWRRMPWIVLVFGVFIIPPGVTSIVLVILQPVGVGAWCTLCLVASVVMLLMVPPALDEVIAAVQFLRRTRKQGGSFWKALWRGEGSNEEEPSDKTAVSSSWKDLLHGIEVFSAPWNLLLATLVGVWLMAAPTVTGLTGTISDITHVIGALVVTFAVVAYAEPTRLVRYLNIPIGLWLLLNPLIARDTSPQWIWLGAVTGVVLIALSIPRGRVDDRYGTWQKWIR